ncbi:RDD family protein [Nocardioides sp.]|uniref:RDD family protein n=1 Tax=Nocardioides sp. TaxID=35761 RepID=UPI0037830CEC
MDQHELSAIPREARAFQGSRAGVVTRVAAATIDGTIIFGALIGLYLGYAGLLFLVDPRTFTFPDPNILRSVLLGGFLMGFYTTVTWAISGRTYGNLLLGLRVTGSRGGDVGWLRALLRAAFYVGFPIGLMWVAIDRRNRSVQDLVLATTVVYDWQPRSHRYRPEP